MYGFECQAINNKVQIKMKVTEMRILRQMCWTELKMNIYEGIDEQRK